MKLVACLRVSTPEQKRKYGFERQAEDVQNFCKSSNHKIVYTLRDDYTGASLLKDRPEGKKVYQLLQSGKAEGVLFPAIDRFGRLMIEMAEMVRDFMKDGYPCFAVGMGEIPSYLDLNFLIQAWQSETAYRTIIKNTQRGRIDKAKSGKPVGTGGSRGVSWGYIAQGQGENHYRTIDQGIASTVLDVYHWYDQGTGVFEIANKLQALGVPSPVQQIKRKGKIIDTSRWTRGKVTNILSNVAYRGIVSYGGIEYHDAALQIIPDDLWYSVEARRQKNFIVKPKSSSYLLTGRLECSCGGRMSGFSTHGYCYYKCWRSSEYSKDDPRRCASAYVRQNDIESCALAWLFSLSLHKDKLASLISDMKQRAGREIEPLVKKQAALKGQMVEAQQNVEKYLTLIDRTSDPLIIQGYESHLQKYADLLRGTQTRLEEIERELSGYAAWTGDTPITADGLRRELAQVWGFTRRDTIPHGLEVDFSRLDRGKAKSVISKYDLKVKIVKGNKIKISCVFGQVVEELESVPSMIITGEMEDWLSVVNMNSLRNGHLTNVILSETIEIDPNAWSRLIRR